MMQCDLDGLSIAARTDPRMALLDPSPDETLYGKPTGYDPPCTAQDADSPPAGGVPCVTGGQGRDAEEVGNSAMVIVWMFAAALFWAIASAVWWWLA